MKKCEKCGKRMWFWQELIMTTNKFGEVVIPIIHDKCDDGKPYYEEKNWGIKNENRTENTQSI